MYETGDVDIDGLRRGESEALAAAVDRCGPWVFELARRGFVCEQALAIGTPPVRARVLGVDTADRAAELTELTLAHVLQPGPRAAIQSEEDLDRAVLERARETLTRAADRGGKLIPAGSELPPECPDLEAWLAQLPATPVPSSAPMATETDALALRAALEGWLAGLAPEDRSFVQDRFREGATIRALCERLGRSPTFLRSTEARLRRKARSRARTALERPVGPFTVDAYLAAAETRSLPPAIAWERLREGVLKRVHPETAAPYAGRLGWATAVLALGVLGWLGMFFGWLPSPSDDASAPPEVRLQCPTGCAEGAEVLLAVRGAEKTAQVGIALRHVDAEGQTRVLPLLVAPDGGSFRLPFGARTRSMTIPHPARLPAGFEGGTVVALFSESPLPAGRLLELARGSVHELGVLTATTAVKP